MQIQTDLIDNVWESQILGDVSSEVKQSKDPALLLKV